MKITDYINGEVTYDGFGTYLWIAEPNTGLQMLGEVRGWGRIQNLFTDNEGKVDFEAAAQFQDEVGRFITEAVNEKIEKLKLEELTSEL
jgi:hypothetical protein